MDENRLNVKRWEFLPFFTWFRNEYPQREDLEPEIEALLSRDPVRIETKDRVPLAGHLRANPRLGMSAAVDHGNRLNNPVGDEDNKVSDESDTGSGDDNLTLRERYKDTLGRRSLAGRSLMARAQKESVNVKRVPFDRNRRSQFREAVMESNSVQDSRLARYYNLSLIAPTTALQNSRRQAGNQMRYPLWLRDDQRHFPTDSKNLPDMPNLRIVVVNQPGHNLHNKVVPIGTTLWRENVESIPELGQFFVLNEFRQVRSTWFRPSSHSCNQVLVRFLRGDFEKNHILLTTEKFKRLLYALQAVGNAETAEQLVSPNASRPTVVSLDKMASKNPIPYRRMIRNRVKGIIGRARQYRNHPQWFSNNNKVKEAIRWLPTRVGAILSEKEWISGLRQTGTRLRDRVIQRIGQDTGNDPKVQFLEGFKGAAQRAGSVSYKRSFVDNEGTVQILESPYEEKKDALCTLDVYNEASGFSRPHLSNRREFKPSIGRYINYCARVPWSLINREVERPGNKTVQEAYPRNDNYPAYEGGPESERWHRLAKSPDLGYRESKEYKEANSNQRLGQRRRAIENYRRLVESRVGMEDLNIDSSESESESESESKE